MKNSNEIENKAQQHVFTCVLLHAFEHEKKNYFVILHLVIMRHRQTHTHTLIADDNNNE